MDEISGRKNQYLAFLEPKIIGGSLSGVPITDQEPANYCVAIALTDGINAKFIHFRTNHTFEEVMRTLTEETISSNFLPSLNFVYGCSDDYQVSVQLLENVRKVMGLLALEITFEDVGGQFDRRGFLINGKFWTERKCFIGGRWDEVEFIF